MATMLDWNWINTVLVGPAPIPLMDITPPSGLLRGFSLVGLTLLLLVLCSMTLPTPGTGWIRLAAFPGIAYFSLTLAVDGDLCTFGAPLRDAFWGILAWTLLAKAADVCLCGTFADHDEVEKCPRWIVPKSQAGKWVGGSRLETSKEGKNATSVKDGKSPPDDHSLPGYVEEEWYLIPHTPNLFCFQRFLWACDHICLLRPQTSWLFPQEQRAMEWAHDYFVGAAADPSSSRYGKPEDRSLLSVLGKLCLIAWLLANAHLLVIPPGPAYYLMPLPVQVFNVLFYGSVICATCGPFEYLAFPVLRRLLPATALLPLMNQPLLATGPADLWGRRWHTIVRRSSWRLAKLFPGGCHPVGNKMWAFVVTGSMHGFVLARWLPRPHSVWYGLVLLLLPGPMAFFVSQGALVALELLVFGPTDDGREGLVKAALRRVLLWGGIAFSCRYYVGAIAAAGLHTAEAQRGGQPW